MKANDVTVEWLKSLSFTRARVNTATIEGVNYKKLNPIVDGRGDVTELWSAPWEGFIPPTHVYQSATDYGVVKCWHLHDEHTDQFTVTRGKLQVSLVDVREDSPTFGHVNVFMVGSLSPGIIRIPPGLMHGWKALTAPEVIVVNLQSHVYDPSDEIKLPWDCILEEIWEPLNG